MKQLISNCLSLVRPVRFRDLGKASNRRASNSKGWGNPYHELEIRSLMAPLAFDSAAQVALRNQLLAGVTQIADMGSEGTVAVFGDHAASVLQDPGSRRTVVAAVDKENNGGRIVAGAKTGMVEFANSSQFNTNAFYLNTVNWLAKGLGASARIVTDISAARTWLLANGFTNVTLRSDWQNGLTTADVLITYFVNPTAAQQTATNNFLASGKGMYVGYNGWAFSYAGVTPITSGGNALLRQFGLSWTEEIAWNFTGTLTRGTEAGNAVLSSAMIAAPVSYFAAQQEEVAVAIKDTFESVPATDPQLVAIRQNVLANVPLSVIPTPATPVSNPNQRFQMRVEASILSYLPANELFAHRTAPSYGAIPAGSARVSRTLTYPVNASNVQDQWLSTGLYAAPGEIVTFTVPSNLVNQGWSWKIGSHDDDISAKTSFRRMPFGVSRDEPIASTTLQAGSVFGGMIYLVKPTTLSTANLSYNVTINNAMEAPYFILGQTTDAQWVNTVRNLPAPFAELRSSNLIISLHSEDIRSLNNPTAVMNYWRDHVAAQDDLTNYPVPRTRAERIDDDLDISAGWMHSGYPIAAYARNLANMVDSDPGDDWGFFHELGHNHQSGYWTFSTEGEVTVNIMTMRSFDSAGTTPADSWRDMWSASGRASRISTFIAGGRLRNDAGTALTSYAQLRAAFGWEPFRQFFRQYQTDAPANLPQNDQQERDQWVTRFSSIVGRNLGPFFNAWGFAASQTALNSVAHLPLWSWLEPVNPNPVFRVTRNSPVTFDVRTGFVDIMNLPLSVSFPAQPASGTLVNNGNGTFTFTPVTNWSGRLELPYTITNQQGGNAVGKVIVEVVNRTAANRPLDTGIRGDSPSSNLSAATSLTIDSDTTAGNPAQVLMAFSKLFGETEKNQIPVGMVIANARLELQITNSGDGIKFHRLLRPWTAQATWSSLGNGIQLDNMEALSIPDLQSGFVNSGTQVFDVTNSIRAWQANPQRNFGWVIAPTGSDGVTFSSAETATPPRLIIDYYPGPKKNSGTETLGSQKGLGFFTAGADVALTSPWKRMVARPSMVDYRTIKSAQESESENNAQLVVPPVESREEIQPLERPARKLSKERFSMLDELRYEW